MPDLLADFLTHLAKERDVSPHTVAAYARDLGELQDFLGRHFGDPQWSWGHVDRLDLRAWMAHLARRGLAKRSIARALSAARTYFRRAVARAIASSPLRMSVR